MEVSFVDHIIITGHMDSIKIRVSVCPTELNFNFGPASTLVASAPSKDRGEILYHQDTSGVEIRRDSGNWPWDPSKAVHSSTDERPICA
ncbi:hypothetical protein BHE74_00027701 [Ensete ventricosum]|nr:hypothetical protein BHE74_00027701 [Ensete ventricosum]